VEIKDFIYKGSIGEVKDGRTVYFADITVVSGFLWWKKEEVREVCSPRMDYWFFTDTGKWTPEEEMRLLVLSYKARSRVEALHQLVGDRL
jgi:hypothetical protein